ncbi:MAG: hypothetical protein U0Q16_26240 [Bryobacteraceae bacterium]
MPANTLSAFDHHCGFECVDLIRTSFAAMAAENTGLSAHPVEWRLQRTNQSPSSAKQTALIVSQYFLRAPRVDVRECPTTGADGVQVILELLPAAIQRLPLNLLAQGLDYRGAN